MRKELLSKPCCVGEILAPKLDLRLRALERLSSEADREFACGSKNGQRWTRRKKPYNYVKSKHDKLTNEE
jgi:hypothetical protein